MAGRNRMPVAVIDARGRSHHITGEVRAVREASEVKPADTTVRCPGYIHDKAARKRFRDLAAMLSALGIWDASDADELGRYVTAQTAYERLSELYADALELGDIDSAGAIQRQQDRAYQQAFRSASSLGLNITSRCRVVPVQPPDQGEKLEM